MSISNHLFKNTCILGITVSITACSFLSAQTSIEDTISPAAPTGLTAKSDNGSITLNWNSNSESDLEGYIVYRSETAVSGYTAIATNISINEYEDDSADNCTTYYYLITAVDAKGNESTKSTGISAAPQIGVTAFGSSNDGLDGFTTSTPDVTQETWSVETDSVRYINDDPDGMPNSGTNGARRNSSLLKAFVLDRTPGNSYVVKGSLNLTDGYADDNNRFGIYLFGDVDNLTDGGPEEDESGALGLVYNSDKGRLRLFEGINRDRITGAPTNPPRGSDDSIYNNNLVTLTAEIAFVESGGITQIEINGSFEDEFGDTTNLNATVKAVDYTGDYFGFVTRARNRGVSGRNRDAPFTLDYKGFSITNCTPSIEPLLLAPADLTATSGNGLVNLDWTQNIEDNSSSYNIYRRIDSENYSTIPIAVINHPISEFTDTSAVNGTTYYYIVTAVDSNGGESAPSVEVVVSLPIDSDGDFMADDWELLYFGSESVKDGSVDSDEDGTLDFFEHLYDSNPTLASSKGFQFSVSNNENGSGVFLNWSVKEGFMLGQDYEIQVSTNLSDWDSLPEGDYSLTETTANGETAVELTITQDYGVKAFLRLVQPMP